MLNGNAAVSNWRRYSAHFWIVFLILVTFLLSRVQAPTEPLGLKDIGAWTSEGFEQPEVVRPTVPLLPVSFLSLTKSPVPKTTIPERPRESIIVYRVEPGDTLYGIAQKFGISGETVIWANQREDNPDTLSIGQELIILPVSGVYHTVQKGDTVESVAAKYKVEPSAITQFALNNLKPPYTLVAGEKIIVPGGQKPYIPRRVVASYEGPVPQDASRGTGIFGWPTSGMLSQKYFSGHRAIDIAGPKGTPIYAADSGYVVMAGFSGGGYGNMVVLEHGNGFQTLYAHLDTINVRLGQSVKKGQKIATMGTSGRTTGPHLHFEVIKGGVQRDPLGVLP